MGKRHLNPPTGTGEATPPLTSTAIFRFKDLTATNGVKWWVNIGMRDTGGWLQEDYGRRYFFWPQNYVDGVAVTKDLMRLCLIRNVTNEANAVGRRHGWPLSQEGERALVFQIRPMAGVNVKDAEMTVAEFVYRGGTVTATQLLCLSNAPSLCNMGLQLAGNKVCVFYIGNAQENDKNVSLKSRAYTFSESAEMTPDTYRYFTEELTVGGKEYGGTYTMLTYDTHGTEHRGFRRDEREQARKNGR